MLCTCAAASVGCLQLRACEKERVASFKANLRSGADYRHLCDIRAAAGLRLQFCLQSTSARTALITARGKQPCCVLQLMAGTEKQGERKGCPRPRFERLQDVSLCRRAA